MAYMSQENKAKLAVGIKKVMPEGWKYSLSVRHHSTLALTITEAPVDLIAKNKLAKKYSSRPPWFPINEYCIESEYDGEILKTLNAIKAAMMVGNWDKSRPEEDSANVGWYIDIHLGRFGRPFVFTGTPRKARVRRGDKKMSKEQMASLLRQIMY